jgi:hypothetical protein
MERLEDNWIENFKKHYESAADLRGELEERQKKGKNEIIEEYGDKELIYHPSGEFTDLGKKVCLFFLAKI